MRSRILRRAVLGAGLMLLLVSPLGLAVNAKAQGTEPSSAPSSASAAVAPGTRFLVRLEDELSTRDAKENSRFQVRTLEPLENDDGVVLPPGAEIAGHVSRVEPAGVTGRARIWLTFDEIKTKNGRLPIVAEVVSVPGEHSVNTGPSKEGEIEGRTSAANEDAKA